ncbi:hypothetical protein SCHPADRAFT_1395 [Schizopora paradoxa]|uniref:Smr domain-containing protein n=1 Tax=Schizopora paradoxa TaxID=27342 RepID=A0A0H2S7U5_9AGAM|nr:hypothetical protein SCHPADRAFT_1395 [Schizopora paradoxa]
MNSLLQIALSLSIRAAVLTYVYGNDVLTGLLLGCWDGAFIHHAWIEDRALEPLTLLLIIAGTCFDISHRSDITHVLFLALGGVLGALFSDAGLLQLGHGRGKGLSMDVDVDGIADAFSGLLPSIRNVEYESDSSSSSSITIKVTGRRDSQRPSTRLSNYSRLTALTGVTSKSGQSRSLSSLPPLTIPSKRSGLPILTLGSSDAGESTPRAKSVPPIPQSWLPASGSYIPRTYSVSSAQSDRGNSHTHRPRSKFGEDNAEYMHMHARAFDDEELPPRSSFVRPRDFAHVSQAESVSVDSDVPEIQVVPPDDSLPVFSPGLGYEVPRSPSKSDHHSESNVAQPNGHAQNVSPSPSIRRASSREASRPSSPLPEKDTTIPPPSPARTTISIQTIRTADGTPARTIINVVPVPSQEAEETTNDDQPLPVPVPNPSHSNVDARNDEPVDWEDYISEPTAPESVVSFAPKTSLLVKAEQYRQQAMQALNKKSQLQLQKTKAEREKRWADAFSLKFQIEEEEELANKFNAKAERRYHAAHNSSFEDDTIDVHGLKPAEATRQVDLKLRRIQLNGGKHLRVIVGRGKHSRGGVPVLKPAVRDHMIRQNLQVDADRKNPGLLHVFLP